MDDAIFPLRAVTLTLGLFKGSGGVNKSIPAFQKALQSEVISWIDPEQHAHNPLIWSKTVIVKGSQLPVLRHLLYTDGTATQQANQIIRGAELVCCHSFWRWHNLWLSKAARQLNLPYWFVPHGSLDPYVFQSGTLGKKTFLTLGGRRFIENADAVIFSTRRELEKASKVAKPSQAEVIYWPLADSDFNVVRDTEAGQRVRAELGIPETARCLIYFGRMHPMKRPLETIDAVAASGVQDLHLLIVGNECGITVQECRNRAKQRGIDQSIHVIGPVYGREISDYFSASDAYISLSSRENFNYTAAECMAAGLPVMLSPGNDLAGEFANTDCGWMLPDSQISTAATAMRLLCELPSSVLREKAYVARQWALKELRFETFQMHLRELASRR